MKMKPVAVQILRLTNHTQTSKSFVMNKKGKFAKQSLSDYSSYGRLAFPPTFLLLITLTISDGRLWQTLDDLPVPLQS